MGWFVIFLNKRHLIKSLFAPSGTALMQHIKEKIILLTLSTKRAPSFNLRVLKVFPLITIYIEFNMPVLKDPIGIFLCQSNLY